MLERKRRQINENNPDKKSDDNNQCDTPISEKSTVNSTNKSMSVAQGPTDDDNKNESRKAWTMEMLMNNGDISTNTMNEVESMSDDEKMFLYTRAVHSNHLPISEKRTVNSINKSTLVAQGPADDDNKNESQKAWTLEMLMNDGDISTNTTNEVESMSDDEKMFLYARVVHSNHSIQYHMHQIMEQQRVVNEYRNMTMEGMNLIPLDSNLHKYNPVIISQIMNMIESDIFWHHKMFESVMSDLRNMWTEGI